MLRTCMPCYKEGDCWQIDYCVSSSLGKMKRWNPMVQNAGVKHMAKEILPINQTGTDFQVDIVDSWYDSKSKGRSQQPPLLHKSSHLWQPSRLATKSNRTH